MAQGPAKRKASDMEESPTQSKKLRFIHPDDTSTRRYDPTPAPDSDFNMDTDTQFPTPYSTHAVEAYPGHEDMAEPKPSPNPATAMSFIETPIQMNGNNLTIQSDTLEELEHDIQVVELQLKLLQLRNRRDRLLRGCSVQ